MAVLQKYLIMVGEMCKVLDNICHHVSQLLRLYSIWKKSCESTYHSEYIQDKSNWMTNRDMGNLFIKIFGQVCGK